MTNLEIDLAMERVFVGSRDYRCCKRDAMHIRVRCDRRVSPRHVYDYAAQLFIEKHVNLCTSDEW